MRRRPERRKRCLALTVCLLLAQFGLAAEDPAQSQDATAGEEALAAQTDADTDQAADANTEQEEQEGEDETEARFIPTEEISQDLGVSFPVDI